MDLIAQWKRALERLELPDTPEALIISAEETAPAISAALRARWPRARIAALRLWPARQDDSTPTPPTFSLHTSTRMLEPESRDLVLLEHALDDFVFHLLAEHERLNLSTHLRGEYAAGPRTLRAYWRSGDLETVIAPELIALLSALGRGLRATGAMIMHHWINGPDLEGQPFDLYSEYIPLVRKWLKKADAPLREFTLAEIESHWWLALAPKGKV